MMSVRRYAACLLIVIFLGRCSVHGPEGEREEDALPNRIEKLKGTAVRDGNRDSLLQAWKALSAERGASQQNLYSARIAYEIARLYGMNRQEDSAAVYLERAFNSIENEHGHLEEKARIYQGIGNVSTSQGQLHRANYYYNKAAAIVLTDSTVQLDVPAKCAILLAAAQSNQQFLRFDLAFAENRKALALSKQLPDGHINRQRPITQMIQAFYHGTQDTDSIGVYIAALEKLHRQYPAAYGLSFVYESKALYHDLKSETDSVLKWQLLKSELEEQVWKQSPNQQTPLNNLFVSYANIAGLYTKKRDFTRANDFFEKAARMARGHDRLIFDDHWIVYHKNRSDFYTLSGNANEALKASNEVNRLQEELYAAQNTQAIAEMNSLYEIQAQERSIKQLNENLLIKELQLQRNQLWLIIAALGISVLGISLFFLYYGFRQRRIRQEKDKMILQQQLLRTQMEPHFIFNTLTALQNYIRRGLAKEAIRYLGHFSKLLRNSLEISRKESVFLEQEIETLEHYLVLQQMRFENAFSYTIAGVDELEIAEISIPPMLIQPFVENAILHGIDMESGNGLVWIGFSEADDVLRVVITDSGRGRVPNTASSGHRSLSGMISRERFALLGKNARIETKKDEGAGTTVTLFIPLA